MPCLYWSTSNVPYLRSPQSVTLSTRVAIVPPSPASPRGCTIQAWDDLRCQYTDQPATEYLVADVETYLFQLVHAPNTASRSSSSFNSRGTLVGTEGEVIKQFPDAAIDVMTLDDMLQASGFLREQPDGLDATADAPGLSGGTTFREQGLVLIVSIECAPAPTARLRRP